MLMNLGKAKGKIEEEKPKPKFEIEEEKGVSCIVCHEGYTFRPNDILGVYIYTKKIKIQDEESLLNFGKIIE